LGICDTGSPSDPKRDEGKIMKRREKCRWRNYYDEQYFEEGRGSSYGRNVPPYSKAGESIKRYHLSYFNLANRYTNRYLDVFDGRGKRALDIGCAYGYGLKLLQGMAYEAHGIDISEYTIKRANDFLGDSGNIAVADAQQLPFKDSQFDLIVSFDLMEHLPYPEQMVADCHRLLKQGGLFLGVTSNNVSPLYRIEIFFNKMESHINARAPWNWRKVFEKHKWQGLRIVCSQWLPKVQRKINLPYLGLEVLILARK
jgi:SAM-dependent methyltransferase